MKIQSMISGLLLAALLAPGFIHDRAGAAEPVSGQAAADSALPLAGAWRFEIDRKDAGKAEGWFKRTLTGSIRLPGSMAENGLGDPMKGIRQQVWGGQWTTEPVWHPMFRIDYRGAAWYQTTVTIPAAWKAKVVELFLERVCWQSELWVDDTLVGSCDSLSAPHGYELGILAPGEHRLTLRIDNRQLYDLGCNTHAYHEPSCTIYNGVIGRIELRARPAVFARACQVYADPATGQCELRVTVVNRTGTGTRCTLAADIVADGQAKGLSPLVKQEMPVPPGESVVKLLVPVPQNAVKLWSEFERPLYTARLGVTGAGLADDALTARFGFRSYTAKGAQFLINGKPVLLRGEANNAQFPLTGYPPMDKAAWLKIFSLFQDFGLNHFRCHAWVPPEAAFDAADELGVYLQPELPNGEDSVTKDTARGLPWRQAEFDRILDTYGNHPSFVQMTMGNEAKTKKIEFLKELVKRGRQHDPRHLYACISNPEASGIRDEVPGDEFAVAHGSATGRRRMEPYFNRDQPETLGDYRQTTEPRPVPQISHETGQWYVYPDLSEIAKYTGVLRPVTLEHFRDLAAKEGVLAQVPDFVNATGRLSLLLYKEEVERSLRTPRYGGFQLLGVQDSFDQGAAYVGMMNNFFEPKPFVAPAAFHEFCGSQTPLARLKKRVWLNSETFAADLELANYGPGSLQQTMVDWQLADGERIVGRGEFGPMNLPDAGLQPVGRVELPLSGVQKAAWLQLQVTVRGTSIRNRWDVWVYPKNDAATAPAGVKVVGRLDAATMGELRDGARVVFLPSAYNSPYPTAMTPPFWSPIMFSNQRQILGLLCDSKHPALREFPTAGHSDWQWFELLFQSAAIRLQGTPADYRPIVQGIDRPDRNHKLALIYETKVGKGRLLVCTLDLNRDLDKRPVARQLRRSLLDYAAGPDFQPTVEIELENNLPAYSRESVLGRLSPKMSADSEHENNWAIYAIDNNPATLWHTNWNANGTPPPHQLTIELKEPLRVKGFSYLPRADCDHGRIAKYRIHASDDGRQWRVLAEGTWPNTADLQRVMLKEPVRSRFFRLEALAEVQGQPWTSVAEFDVIPDR